MERHNDDHIYMYIYIYKIYLFNTMEVWLRSLGFMKFLQNNNHQVDNKMK